MPKQEGQKTKLLALLHIFEQKTDENHLLNVPQLVELLEQQGILAERKSIYSDIDTLCALGYDIQLRRGRGGGGYVHYHGGAGAVLPAVPEQHSGNHDDFGHEGLREGGKTHEKNEEVPPDGAGGAGHFLLLRGSLGGRRAALHDVQLRLLG